MSTDDLQETGRLPGAENTAYNQEKYMLINKLYLNNKKSALLNNNNNFFILNRI